MNIIMQIVMELDDGSAIMQLTCDNEAKSFLMAEGLTSLILNKKVEFDYLKDTENVELPSNKKRRRKTG